MESTSWGGSIELLVLSKHFKCEIVAVDIQNERYDIFGESQGYKQRIYVLYSGIHYDLAVKNVEEDGP
jgi:ubiquitin thioesterase OTU1